MNTQSLYVADLRGPPPRSQESRVVTRVIGGGYRIPRKARGRDSPVFPYEINRFPHFQPAKLSWGNAPTVSWREMRVALLERQSPSCPFVLLRTEIEILHVAVGVKYSSNSFLAKTSNNATPPARNGNQSTNCVCETLPKHRLPIHLGPPPSFAGTGRAAKCDLRLSDCPPGRR